MAPHESHEPLDGNERNQERYDAANDHDGDLVHPERASIEKHVLAETQGACAEHDRNGQEERELRGNRARRTQQQAANNGRSGARGSRDERKHLEHADAQCGRPRQILEPRDGAEVAAFRGLSIFGRTSEVSPCRAATRAHTLSRHANLELMSAPPFDHDERNAVDNESRGHHRSVVEMLLHEVVEQDADHRGRNACNDDLPPQRPGGATTLRAFARAKRIELVEEVHAHR